MRSVLNEVATSTIRSIRIHSTGGPETVFLDSVPPPEPAPGEVLVRVHAAGVNPLDWKIREGLMGQLPMPRALGCDFSGVIEAVGSEVSDFLLGQAVFGHSKFGGAFSEFIAVPVVGIAAKPLALDDLEAAATPTAALTAWQALFDVAGLQSGHRVLIHGGAGGVGMFATQFALRAGAWVAATSSARNLSALRTLGVNQAIDYNATRFEEVVKSVDIVLDLVGGQTLERSWRILKVGGRLVSTVSTPSPAMALLCGVRAFFVQMQTSGEQLAMIGDIIANGEIKVMVERVMSFERASEALELSRRSHARGKIVLTMQEEAHHEQHSAE